MLRNRLVVGIMNDRIQQRLLAEKQLTFKRAYDLAIPHETAEKNTTKLQQKEASSALGNPEGESIHQSQNSLYTSYRGNEYPKQVTGRLTRYLGVVIAVVNRDTNSSSAGSRMSNVLVVAKLGMRRLFVAQ